MTSPVNISHSFQKWKPFCESHALKSAFRFNIDIDDMKSESYCILVNCLRNYDSKKNTPFKIYLQKSLKSGLGTYARKNTWATDIYSMWVFDED